MNLSGEFFDSFAGSFDTIYDGKRNWFMRAVDRRFRSDMFVRFAMTFELLGDLSGKSILDIGCGSGPYIVEACSRGAREVIGIDPAPSMLTLAAARVTEAGYRQRVTFIEGYFPEVIRADARIFDSAIVMGVMDYVPDAFEFSRALRESVRDMAVLSFPSRHWFRSPIRKLRYRARRCPVYFYDEATIENLMKKAGVTDCNIFKIPGAGMDFVVRIKP